MSALHRVLPREDDDEAVLAARAERERVVTLLRALRQVAIPDGHRDYWPLETMLRTDPARLTDRQLLRLSHMAWTWRRRLPPALAPKLNPNDPIVRAFAALRSAHG